MNRKINTLLAGIACIVLLASCSTLKKSTSTSLNVASGVQQYPTVVDLKVNNKIEKQLAWGFVPFNIGQPTLDNRKENLVADAVKENNADILLEPQMTYTKKSFGQRTLTLTGYPATFKDFRKATKEDLEALRSVAPFSSETKIYQVSKIPWYKRIFRK